MMPVLNAKSRSALAVLGAALACIGFVLVPLYGRSGTELVPHAAFVNTTGAALVRESTVALATVNDPFARPLEDDAPASRAVERGPRGKRDGDPVLRAIVSGAHPLALISFADGSTRIVGPGESVGSSRITAIEPHGVALADGRRLGFPKELR